MRWSSAILGLILALIAFMTLEKPAYAHLRWFVDKGQHPGEHYHMDLTSLLVIFGAFSFLLFAFAIDRTSLPRKFELISEKAYGSSSEETQWRVVVFVCGLLLVANSATGAFLAYNLVLPSDELVIVGSIALAIVGLLMLSQLSYSLAGLLILIVALPLAAIYLPMVLLIDYLFEFAALGLALVFLGTSSCYLDKLACKTMKVDPKRFMHLPLPIVRVGVGLTLIVLAIHNKLIDPNMALTFLDEHDLNFMADLGFTGFTNLHFVLAAGVAELTLGILLVAGVATRFVAAALIGFFLSTLIILGPIELFGHLTLMGIAFLLVRHGSGSYRLASPDAGGIAQLSRAGA